MIKDKAIYSSSAKSLYIDEENKILVYKRNGVIFAFNFNPDRSFDGYMLKNLDAGVYTPIMSTDDKKYGGDGRVSMSNVYRTGRADDGSLGFKIYLPSRCALCLKKN